MSIMTISFDSELFALEQTIEGGFLPVDYYPEEVEEGDKITLVESDTQESVFNEVVKKGKIVIYAADLMLTYVKQEGSLDYTLDSIEYDD